jgi:hypothetical protein
LAFDVGIKKKHEGGYLWIGENLLIC